MRAARSAAALLVVLLAAAALGACDPGSPASGAASAVHHVTTQSTSASTSVTVSGGVTTYQPADAPEEAMHPDPNFDYGFVVQIASDGFHPHWLVAGCCRTVTWRNLSGRPQSVVFDHQLVSSGLIAPGGTFIFTPQHPVSITYHSGVDPAMTGALQVNQEFDGP